MLQATVFKANDYAGHQFIATANCFFFSFLELDKQVSRPKVPSESVCAARPGRIEVTDRPAPMHSHNGITIVFVAAGYGIFRTEHEDTPIQAGDVILIPAKVSHLSVAGPNTVLTEYSVFIGDPQDFDANEI